MTEPEMGPEFRRALDILGNSRLNLFLAGRAGTGKSTLLRYFRATTGRRPVMLAPSGVAALNIGGQTIHSFFGFCIDVSPGKIRKREIRPRDPALFRLLDMVVIDEVSMLRADLLDCMDAFLRLYGPFPGRPLGGVQVVFSGDMCQLPPVVRKEERAIFSTFYHSPWFFSARVFGSLPLEVVELGRIYRQKDQEFSELLDRIRSNRATEEDLATLNRCCPATGAGATAAGQPAIILTTTNRKADAINERRLEELPGQLHVSEAGISGSFGREYFPAATVLRYREGARVMMLNNDQKRRWVNGSTGVIAGTGYRNGVTCVRIRLDGRDRAVTVVPFVWEVYRFSAGEDGIESSPAGWFSQYPFRLAWAVTIHRSQGQTFGRIEVDMEGGAFANGQLYVALSRCTSLGGIRLTVPARRSHIRTDARVGVFLRDCGVR